MRANKIKGVIDVNKITIGEALWLKLVLGLTDSEAIAMFLGGPNRENVQV